MALFSRRPKPDETPAPEPEAPPAAPDAEASPSIVLPEEIIPEVGISFSTFGQAASARAVLRPAAEAPPRSETVPGMPDNVVLRAALDALPEKPENLDVMDVMRQTLQGHLYLRVRGDARTLVAEGKPLSPAVSTIEDKRFLLAYTGGDPLQAAVRADGDSGTSALGQPVGVVLANALAGDYSGIILDHATPTGRIALPIELIRKAVEEGDPELTVKNLLCRPRDQKTAVDIAGALARVKLWVAAGPADENGRFGLAEARTAEGARTLEVFSHPLEVIAMRRGDRPLPLTGAQLRAALASDSAISGVVVDPAGPWIRLDREPLLAGLAAGAPD